MRIPKEITIPRSYIPFLFIFLAITYGISFFLIRTVLNFPSYCFATCKNACPIPLSNWHYQMFEGMWGGSLNISPNDLGRSYNMSNVTPIIITGCNYSAIFVYP